MGSQNQWTNTPNLEWRNTPNNQWDNTIVLVILKAAITFISNSKSYFFESSSKVRDFVSTINNYFFESKNKS